MAGPCQPNAVWCTLCGKPFFPDSLPFHLKACRKKPEYVLLPCEWCGVQLIARDLKPHLRYCAVAKEWSVLCGAARPQSAETLRTAHNGATRTADARRLLHDKARPRDNASTTSQTRSQGLAADLQRHAADAAYTAKLPEGAVCGASQPWEEPQQTPRGDDGGGGGDGRIACAVCGRKFAPARAERHERVCRVRVARGQRTPFCSRRQRLAGLTSWGIAGLVRGVFGGQQQRHVAGGGKRASVPQLAPLPRGAVADCSAQPAGGSCAAALGAGERSCCSDDTCRHSAECGDGKLRPGTALLAVGNSHMRETLQAIVCANLDSLESISFQANVTAEANAAIMAGGALPPLTTWTYNHATGAVLDADGDARDKAPPDDVAVYAFASGARLYTLINTPLQLTPAAAAPPAETPVGLAAAARHLGFALGDLSALLVNRGNYRRWAHRLWCAGGGAAARRAGSSGSGGGSSSGERRRGGEDDGATGGNRHGCPAAGAGSGGGGGGAARSGRSGTHGGSSSRASAGGGGMPDRCSSDGGGSGSGSGSSEGSACAALADASREDGMVVDVDALLSAAAAAGFRGRALVLPRVLEGQLAAAPIDVAAAAAALPFGVEYWDWGALLQGRMCACPDCRDGSGHQCLPGPPGDAAGGVLRRLYSAGDS
ncbi:hypothetical protein JKP88DRAFT_318911 [Tribonema minus]|uniref:C2HC/C3H-type domain-containing protein n=1 Tax=Tribonema minus TaxID=303371 RepID=A0A836CE68_9STRA|nr:hypothetical protein JKP88DRAFT_318911 [Tribonema minus]